MKHLHLELERLESRIAPGGGLGIIGGIDVSAEAEVSGSSSNSSGSKSSGSKGSSSKSKSSGSKSSGSK